VHGNQVCNAAPLTVADLSRFSAFFIVILAGSNGNGIRLYGVGNMNVLIVGIRAAALVPRLEARGYACETAVSSDALERRDPSVRPHAIVLSSTARGAPALLADLRRRAELKRVPVFIDASAGWRASLRRLDVDFVAESLESLEGRLATIRETLAHAHHSQGVEERLALLVEVVQSAAAGSTLQQAIDAVALQARKHMGWDHLSLVFSGAGHHPADVATERFTEDPRALEFLQRAVEQGETVQWGDWWFVPLSVPGLAGAAVVIRTARPLSVEEVSLVQAIGHALAPVVKKGAAIEGNEALQDAYLERYKELVEANARLRTQDRKKNELMDVLSHDLRAPLNVMLGYAHILLTDDKLSSHLRGPAEAIQRAGKKVLSLVESLLDQARETDGRMVLFTRLVDVSELCLETVRELQVLAAPKGLSLRHQLGTRLEVVADDLKLRQVLQNLVTNALAHSRDATEVVVRSTRRERPDGDVAMVEVYDNGRVAEPGQVLLSFDRSAGLGLSICRDFIERHGGEIWAEVRPEGGTVFAFTIPFPSAQPPVRAVQSAEPLLLIVDDDPIFTRLATMALSGQFRVELARDGNEAVRRARALRPDIIMMDVFMPNRDGLDALRELQAHPDTATIPVILLSSRPELPQRVKPEELGAADFLAKPLAPGALSERVRGVFEKSVVRHGSPTVPGFDAETTMLNKGGLSSHLAAACTACAREGRTLVVASFSPLTKNDRVGQCALTIQRSLRLPDFGAHVGAGRFVVVFPQANEIHAQGEIGRLVGVLADEGVAYRSRMFTVSNFEAGVDSLLERLWA
jgi:two-component system sensor histidine kinase ChiS